MKPGSHSRITELALGIYKENNSSELCASLDKPCLRKALLFGTRVEDWPLPKRGKNWHFYPANKTIEEHEHIFWSFPKIVIRPISRPILKIRMDKLNSLAGGGACKKLFKTFGRALHHIQDMSTPSHVVPAYHGPKLKDKYEDFLVDHWEALSGRVNDEQEKLMDVLTEPAVDLVTLYGKAGKRLLRHLYSNDSTFAVTLDGVQTKGTAELLWQQYDPRKDQSHKRVPFDIPGFGDFGPVGIHFGETEPFEEKSHTYQVDHDTYLKIAAHFVASAVADTLRALRVFEGLVEGRVIS